MSQVEYRKAALALYPLRRNDRDWLLARLPQAQRASLGALLRELESLGIPRDGFDPSALAEPDAGAADALPADMLSLLDEADAIEIRRLLESEPVPVAAGVLSLHRWRWRAAVLRSYPPSARKAIAIGIEAGRRNGLPDALRAALLAALARRLRAQRAAAVSADDGRRARVYKPRRGMLNRAWRSLWPA